MQGVQVPAGAHTIEFKFLPPVGLLYVSMAAVGFGLGLLGVFIFEVNITRMMTAAKAAPAAPEVKPAEPAAKATQQQPKQQPKGKRKQPVAVKGRKG